MTTTMITTRIWTGGEGRGRGREKDGGMTTLIRNMGNIQAYLPAMMMGGTTTRTFPSSQHQILARRPTTFLPWPYRCRPSRHCHYRRQERRWRRQVDEAIEDLWPFPLGMTMMASNKKVDNDDIMTRIQATARPPSLSLPTLDTRGAFVTTWIATMTTIHAAAAAQIKGETTRASKIVEGTTRGTGITMQCHATTNKWRA